VKFVFGFLDFGQLAAFWPFVRYPTVFVQVVDTLKSAVAKHMHIRVCPSECALENSIIML